MVVKEIRFLLALWKANLLSVMEYRTAFLAQVFGMILNNAAYFIFWIVFFNQFNQVHGWELADMFILFGIAASSFGLGVYLFGNIVRLSEIITQGQLDYYLSLPRPVLLHALASRSIPSGMGDFTYGILSYIVARQFTADSFLRFFLVVLLGMLVFLSFMVIIHSLAFFVGNASLLSQQAFNAIITFAIYPISLFEGGGRFVLYVILPAAFMGSVPAGFVKSADWINLAQLSLAVIVLAGLAFFVFQRGLRRYESGSAIQIQI